MRTDAHQVDCEFLGTKPIRRVGIGGGVIDRQAPVCRHPDAVRPSLGAFWKRCAECEHNEWLDGSEGMQVSFRDPDTGERKTATLARDLPAGRWYWADADGTDTGVGGDSPDMALGAAQQRWQIVEIVL